MIQSEDWVLFPTTIVALTVGYHMILTNYTLILPIGSQTIDRYAWPVAKCQMYDEFKPLFLSAGNLLIHSVIILLYIGYALRVTCTSSNI